MIKYDFKTFMDVDGINDYDKEIHEIRKILEKRENGEIFLDTDKCISKRDLDRIKKIAKYVINNAKVFLVIGIGGSYMGSRALIELLKKNDIEIIYAGYSLSSKQIDKVLETINKNDVVVNVISNSGNTIETNLVFAKVLEVMKKKYSSNDLKKRIIVTTHNKAGKLYKIAYKNYYTKFIMPKISGRYSVLTAAGLLPMVVAGIDVDNLIKGFNNEIIDKCFLYAIIRDLLYKQGKRVEAFTIYDEDFLYFNEWLKQLYAETQGKNHQGILPISVFNTRDMHSLGQYFIEGEDIVFETVINVVNNKDVVISKISLNKLNNMIMLKSAKELELPSIIINMDRLNEENIGELLCFFMTSAVIGSYLKRINPYNQPGVKEYKRIIKESLECIK